MNKEKLAKLAAKGWKSITVGEFLKLTPKELDFIEKLVESGESMPNSTKFLDLRIHENVKT